MAKGKLRQIERAVDVVQEAGDLEQVGRLEFMEADKGPDIHGIGPQHLARPGIDIVRRTLRAVRIQIIDQIYITVYIRAKR